jgi:hypothetical protein
MTISNLGASGTELLADIYAGLGDYVAIGQVFFPARIYIT